MRISDWSSDVCSSDLAKPAKAALSGTLVKAAPVKTATTRKAAAPKTPGNGAVAHGWTAQIAPIKAQAEKAAKAAADKLNAVDWKAHNAPLKDQASKTAKSAAGVAKDKTGQAMQNPRRRAAERGREGTERKK